MNLPVSQDYLEDLEMDMLETNSSLTCAESTLLAANESLLPTAADITTRVVIVLYDILLVALGIPLNILILFLFTKFKKLRDVSFAIAFQIAFVNLLLAIVKLPAILSSSTGRLILGLNFCIFQIFMTIMLFYARGCLIFVFSLDRFVSVFAPFNYPKYSYKVTITLCMVSWCLALTNTVILTPPVLDCFGFIDDEVSCKFLSNCNKNCQLLSYIFLATHVIPVTFVPAGLFFALYFKGRKIRRQVNKMLGLSENMSEQDRRALKTFTLLLLAVFLVTFPPMALALLSIHFGQVVHIFFSKISHAAFSTLIITDPVIILRNADVKQVLRTLLNGWKKICFKTLKIDTPQNNIINLDQVSSPELPNPATPAEDTL